MARPRIKIDPKLIRRMARIGCTVEEMAGVLGCSKDTLERRFAAAIEKGRFGGKRSLKHKQFQVAMGGKGERANVTMLIWLGKQYLGQSDKQDVTTGGQPISFVDRPTWEKV